MLLRHEYPALFNSQVNQFFFLKQLYIYKRDTQIGRPVLQTANITKHFPISRVSRYQRGLSFNKTFKCQAQISVSNITTD